MRAGQSSAPQQPQRLAMTRGAPAGLSVLRLPMKGLGVIDAG